jgi:N-acetylneuraminic acid mutarotase
MFLVALLACCSYSSSEAQSRDYHTQRIILDDGNGHTATVQYTGTTTTTFGIPTNSPNSGDVITSDGSGGTTWQSPGGGVPSGTVIMSTNASTPTGYTLLGGPVTISTGATSWVTESSTGANIRLEGAMVAVDGKLYVVGGSPNNGGAYYSDVEVYDPVANSWSTDATTGTCTPRLGIAAVYCNGLIYEMGGATTSDYSNVNEAYDPVAKSWSTKAPMPVKRGLYALQFSGNYIYAMSGENNGGNVTATDVYDVVNNNWNMTKTAASTPVILGDPNSAILNGKFYLAGGFGSGSSQYLYSYDPVGNSWASLSTTGLTDRNEPGVASAAGKLYVFGGQTNTCCPPSNSLLTTNQAYDPNLNSWSTSISTGFTARSLLMAASINATIYAFGGYAGLASNVMEALTPGFSAYYYVKN